MDRLNKITITVTGKEDIELLLWNKEDVRLLRKNYRIICNYVGCLPSNPLQNHELSLPALLTSIQLLTLVQRLQKTASASTQNFSNSNILKIHLEYFRKRSKRIDLSTQVKSLGWDTFLPELSKELYDHLIHIKNTIKYKVYEQLYFSEYNYFITSGAKFGGDFLLYYDDPERCHSQHIVNVFSANQKIKLKQLISYGRLANGVNKSRVLAAVPNSSTSFRQAPNNNLSSNEQILDKEPSKQLNDIKPRFFTLVWSGII